MGGGISQPSTDLAPTCTETCYAYGCGEEHFGSVGQTMHSSYAYAGNDYDEYLDWCAHNPEDQNVVDYTPDYTEDVGNYTPDYDDTSVMITTTTSAMKSPETSLAQDSIPGPHMAIIMASWTAEQQAPVAHLT